MVGVSDFGPASPRAGPRPTTGNRARDIGGERQQLIPSWASDGGDYPKQLSLGTTQKPDPYDSSLNSNYFAEHAAKELISLTSYLKCWSRKEFALSAPLVVCFRNFNFFSDFIPFL